MSKSLKSHLVFNLISCILLSLIFGFHSYACFLFGYVYSYFLLSKSSQSEWKIKNVKLNNNHFSLIKMMTSFDHSLNRVFNRSSKKNLQSAIRVLSPQIFIFIISFGLGYQVDWYFTLIGSVLIEFAQRSNVNFVQNLRVEEI